MITHCAPYWVAGPALERNAFWRSNLAGKIGDMVQYGSHGDGRDIAVAFSTVVITVVNSGIYIHELLQSLRALATGVSSFSSSKSMVIS